MLTLVNTLQIHTHVPGDRAGGAQCGLLRTESSNDPSGATFRGWLQARFLEVVLLHEQLGRHG